MSGPQEQDALPVGTPVMLSAPDWGVAVGIVEACQGTSAGYYCVRLDTGATFHCTSAALFDLRLAAGRPAISIVRQAGRA